MNKAVIRFEQIRPLWNSMFLFVMGMLLTNNISYGQQLQIDLGIDLANPDFVHEFNSSFEVGLRPGAPAMDERESVIISVIYDLYQTDIDAALDFALNEVDLEQSRAARAQRAERGDFYDYVYSANVEYAIGQLYQFKGNRPKAEEYYLKAIEKFPAYVSAYARLMEIYMNQDDCQRAIVAGQKAVEIGGANGNVFKGIGLCLMLENDHGAALSAFRVAKTFMPNDIGISYYYAVSALNLGYSGEAISVLDELILDAPDTANYYSLQVNAYLSEDDYNGALATLDIARRKGLLNSSSYSLLGNIYINKEMPEAAAEAYGNSLVVGRLPPFADMLDAFDYLYRLGESEIAESHLGRVTNSYRGRLNQDERRKLDILRARILVDSGQATEGAELLRDVIDADPTNGDALLALASYYRQQRDFERAAIFFERAESEEEVALNALMAHAEMATDREDWQGGVELLRRAREYASPDSLAIIEENIRALERLLNLVD